MAMAFLSRLNLQEILQTLSVLQWVPVYIFLGAIPIILIPYFLVFTKFWMVSVLALAWLAYDWNTHSQGVCPVSELALKYLLTQKGSGNAVVIVVGGAAEALLCHPGASTVFLKQRKGFVKVALKTGAYLVPSYSFGQNEVHNQETFPEGTWKRFFQKTFQNTFKKILGLNFCTFHGRGLIRGSWGFLPFNHPITTVVGEPLPIPKIKKPNKETVDKYHALYINALRKLFDEHKVQYGLSETQELTIFGSCSHWPFTYCLHPGGHYQPFTLPGFSWTGRPQSKILKTKDLSPEHNYLMGVHPHGLLTFGAFCNFCTEATGFSKIFPGITPHLATLSWFFKIPFIRDYLMAKGVCSVSQPAIEYLLSHDTGNLVGIVVGGVGEALQSVPNTTRLILQKRKGFVRMALQHGAHLVPTYTFGETEVYDQVLFHKDSFMYKFQSYFRQILGFYFCIFYGRGFRQGSTGLLPYPLPIVTVVGEPLPLPKIENPSQEMVDKYHALYMKALTKLFDQHKTQYGCPETQKLLFL
ncbi:hypothetical protein MG293_005605 [Ovis ammon polii]|uniref:Acyltransferase n=1 Tax=Ovis ammon polii TaxID=230172 RepID=A0AAD4UIL2_OVIAM|nr:hypothetical protein MG293_005605 [Ovis ammon polii]